MSLSWGEFEARLRYRRRPGHRPWLRADFGTKRVLTPSAEPFDAVHNAVGALSDKLETVPADVARRAVNEYGVYGAADPTRCDSWEAALEEISQSISESLVAEHEFAVEYFDGEEDEDEDGVYRLSLYGGGVGVLFQQTTKDGAWLEQQCFMIDPGNTVHFYYQFDR